MDEVDKANGQQPIDEVDMEWTRSASPKSPIRPFYKKNSRLLRPLCFFAPLCLCVSIMVACATPRTGAYQRLYAHLKQPCHSSTVSTCSDCFLIIFVDARHLDYTDCESFLRTMCKHPSDGSKNGDVGHAWIYLKGVVDGESFCVEGGHSGELGARSPRYFDGIMNYIETGYSHLRAGQCAHPRYEPNPVRYLWEPLHDGYFESGAGGHKPTFAVKVNLTVQQFQRILEFTQVYCYRHYCLTGNQCSTFVTQVASLAGLELDCEVTMPIPAHLTWKGEMVRLWSDPSYAELTVATPDILEKSLMQAVRDGRAELIWNRGRR